MEMRLNRIQLMGRIGLVPCPSMRKIDERNRYFPVGKPENVPAQETMLRMLPGVLRGRAKTSKCPCRGCKFYGIIIAQQVRLSGSSGKSALRCCLRFAQQPSVCCLAEPKPQNAPAGYKNRHLLFGQTEKPPGCVRKFYGN